MSENYQPGCSANALLEIPDFETKHEAPPSQVQTLCHCFKFTICNTQIPLGIRNAFVVELVHYEGKIYPLHSGMVAPGFSQAVSAKVAR